MSITSMHDGRVVLHQNDCRDVLRGLADNSIDSVVTDPPYALVSIQKRLGKPGSAPVKIDDPEKSGCIKAAYARASAGFMGKTWDTGEVAFSEEFWAEVLRVLKPGGHVVAFSGTRTYHRMAVAIEDAGFEIRDQCKWMHDDDSERDAFLASLNDEQRAQFVKLFEEHGAGQLSWDYGSVFPKSHAIDVGLWKGVLNCQSKESAPLVVQLSAFTHLKSNEAKEPIVAAPALILPEVAPALIMAIGREGDSSEVTVMSLSESEAESISLSTGWSWAMNLDVPCDPRSMYTTETNSRQITTQEIWKSLTSLTMRKSTPRSATLQNGWTWPVVAVESSSSGDDTSKSAIPILTVLGGATWNPVAQAKGTGTSLKPAWEPICLARKPLDGTVAENVLKWGVGALNIDGCRVGTTVETWPKSRSYAPGQIQPGGKGETMATGDAPPGRWPANIVHDGSEEVLAAFPDAKGQQGYVGPKHGERPSKGIYGDFGARPDSHPRVEAETSAARFFYCAKASRADRDAGLSSFETKTVDVLAGHRSRRMDEVKRPDGATPATGKNTHPTVKPTTLMQWLCRLITPPGGIILDPFMGSGSTGKAAVLEGFQFIGCEREDEYMPIATARIAWAIGATDTEQRPAVAKQQPAANDNHDLFAEVRACA